MKRTLNYCSIQIDAITVWFISFLIVQKIFAKHFNSENLAGFIVNMYYRDCRYLEHIWVNGRV